MNIGDRVRLIHDKQEGVITKIIDDRLVEVSTEDGFSIPILKQELAKVNREEDDFFEDKKSAHKPESDSNKSSKVIAASGIYLGFVSEDSLLNMCLINNTDFNCPYTFSELKGSQKQGLNSGMIKPKDFESISVLNLENINNWPEFELIMLFGKKGNHKSINPLVKNLKIKSKRFFKDEMTIPLIEKPGYYFQLDQSIEAEGIQEFLNESRERIIFDEVEDKIKFPSEIDLHFEVLFPNAPEMSNGEILQYQLDYFEKYLDKGIAKGVDEITFIHGIGNGKLRMEMHRILSKHQHIKSFKDARKEKFGYGATLVRIK